MAKKKPKPESPFLGRWHIVSMTEWDEDYINEEVQAFIEFEERREGRLPVRLRPGRASTAAMTTRDGEPAVEWSWEGNDDDGRP